MSQHQRGTHRQIEHPRGRRARLRTAEGREGVRPTEADRIASVTELVEVGAENLCAWVPRFSDPLDAEMLASDVCGRWHAGPGGRAGGHEPLLSVALTEALTARADAAALAGLRALSSGGSDAVARLADRAAERLADGGLADPPWWERSQTIRPTRAGLLVVPEDRSTEVVLIEFDRSGGPRHCVVAVVAHGRGGVATSLELTQDAETLGRRCAEDSGGPSVGLLPLGVGEARTRILHAMRRAETLGDPLRTESYGWYRGLVQRRLEISGREVRRTEAGVETPAAERRAA